jgi:HEPN domain-containing protein
VREETEAWLASGEPDAGAARVLLDGGFYSQAVFYTHLSVEKMLKALVLERHNLDRPPLTHNLALLESAVDSCPDSVFEFLATLSPESTLTRYTLSPDDEVYTAELARLLLDGADETTRWLRQLLT